MTVAYETWGTLDAARDNAVLVLHALTGDSHAAGPAGPGPPSRPGGGTSIVGPGQGDRHRPLLRRVPERARRLPGDDRARRRSIPATGTPYGSRFPTITIRDQVVVEAALADMLGIDRVGRASSAARWAASARSSGRCRSRSACRARSSLAAGARATAEEIALCSLQIRAIEADPRFRGGDYYDAEPGDGPWRGMSLARGIGQVSYRSEEEFDERFGRGRQGDEQPLDGRALRGRVLPRVPRREARATASTRTPTSCCRGR